MECLGKRSLAAAAAACLLIVERNETTANSQQDDDDDGDDVAIVVVIVVVDREEFAFGFARIQSNAMVCFILFFFSILFLMFRFSFSCSSVVLHCIISCVRVIR